MAFTVVARVFFLLQEECGNGVKFRFFLFFNLSNIYIGKIFLYLLVFLQKTGYVNR